MPRVHTQPLAGATVIVTRPSSSAASQVRAARALGARVVRLPGLGLRPMADRAATAHALAGARRADAWIFTSPAAVRFAFRFAPALRPRHGLRVFAVGAGTARALARRGIDAIHPRAHQDSAGLLALPELHALRDRHVVLVDAPGGRGLIAPALARRGARVERIAVYERVAPRLDARHWRALAAAPRPWLTLLSSGEALTHLLAALPAGLAARWRAAPLVVSSERLAGLATRHGFGQVCVAASAGTADLLETACRRRNS